jgi:hypothetical protein
MLTISRDNACWFCVKLDGYVLYKGLTFVGAKNLYDYLVELNLTPRPIQSWPEGEL